ncbi:DUF805 domain-containing protein [Chitinibacter fontanus]|uniref:DUF805 domain-containing protein n=1 Tax=Chitinibacter fontanus TaxID=1737446 RepID=A0A7D5V9Z3_9NEIS|nr:DUF805 domain-containing protein [Chitinibacter fontanus]QLI81811.1 DUF805 domain-containing protein [Chitinibacter fontanus]
MDTTFRLVLTGKLLPGVAAEHATAALAKLMRLEIDRAEMLLQQAPTVVKKALPGHQLDTYLQLFHKVGVEVTAEALQTPPPAQPSLSLEPIATPATTAPLSLLADEPAAIAPIADTSAQITCPQCQRVQPKRTLCLGCGADMPRMLAAQSASSTSALPPIDAQSAPAAAPSQRRSRMRQEYETPAFWSLSTEGRLGRMRYFCNGLLSILPVLGMLLFGLLISKGEMTLPVVILFLGAIVWCLVQNYRMMVFRLHDLNKPTKYAGWIIFGQMLINAATRSSTSTTVIIIGSMISLFVYGALAFVQGDDGENDYGLPAAPPNIFHYLASLICGIALIGTIIQTTLMDSPKAAPRTPAEAAQTLTDSEVDQLIAQVEQQSGEKMTREEARARIQQHIEQQQATSQSE